MNGLIKATAIPIMGIVAICLPSCAGHSDFDIEQFSELNTRVDSLDDKNQTAETTGGIVLNINDTVMDEETETLVFHSQDWDEVDTDVDL